MQYIYYEDKFGATIGYIDNINQKRRDIIFVKIIAEKYNSHSSGLPGDWITSSRDITIAVDMKKAIKWEIYENYEKFFELYWEAIL